MEGTNFPSGQPADTSERTAATAGAAREGVYEVAGTASEATQQVAAAASEQAGVVASTAKEQAGVVAGTASEQAGVVAGTTKEQVFEVASVAKEQVATLKTDALTQGRELAGTAVQGAKSQADSKVSKAAGSFQSIGSQLEALASGRPEDAGQFASWAQQASSSITSYASSLDERGLDGVVSDVTGFAKRRPGAFLLGATAAGLVVGRLLKEASGKDEPEDVYATDVSDPVYSYDAPPAAAPGLYPSDSTVIPAAQPTQPGGFNDV